MVIMCEFIRCAQNNLVCTNIHLRHYSIVVLIMFWPGLPERARPLQCTLESGVRVTRDVGYLYANFSLPRPLGSRLRPDVRDRQTSDRQIDTRSQTSDSIIA